MAVADYDPRYDSEEEEPIPTPPINPREPEYFRKPVFGAVLLEIREILYPHWFELFQAVGLDRKVLVDIYERYRKDPKICMVEGIRLWLDQDPLPCWDDMVDQIRQCLLEVELADRIEKTYCKYTRPARAVAIKAKLARNDQEDDYDDIFGTAPEDAGGPEFNLVLVNLNDMVNRSSFFTLAHYLCTLRCPDGTPFLDPELIHTRKTIDSILLPLLLQSYISSRDLDLLIHVFEIMNREDIIKMLKDHLAKVTMGGPRERRLKDTKRNFNVRCVVEKGVGLNMQKVVTIKKKLLSLFRLEDYPFIIQYVGWRTRPLSLTYQMPQACMQTVKESITGSPIVLKEEKIRRMVVSIGTAKFLYNFI